MTPPPVAPAAADGGNNAHGDAEEAGLRPLIAKLTLGGRLTRTETRGAFVRLMEGKCGEAESAGFLIALAMGGEGWQELEEAAAALRRYANTVSAPAGAVDTCGTGGDGLGSFNISTAAALVAAAAGAVVAKHGNRAQSSRCGSADVLEALGVNLDASNDALKRSWDKARFAFLMAQRYHKAMRHVAPVRRALGVRTIFNLVGPLANPAGVRRYVTGVFAERWLEPVARAHLALGAERAFVVHGADGCDELTLSGESHIVEVKGGRLHRFTVTPSCANLPEAPTSAVAGGDAAHNAELMRALLAGGGSASLRNAVAFNAAAALVVAGCARSLKEGTEQALCAIADGSAAATLRNVVALSRSEGA